MPAQTISTVEAPQLLPLSIKTSTDHHLVAGGQKETTMSCTQEHPKKRDRSNENFKKKWRTFVKSGFQTHRDYNADVYILLRRKGQTYKFKSSNQAWPLTGEDLVGTPLEKYSLSRLTKIDRKSVSRW